jgi:ParB-like chromosome segregation protein Spo0J
MVMTRERVIKIEELIKDDNNAREHSTENMNAITKSLKQFGPARSIVVDKDDVVRAGNGTFEAARELGIENVRVIEASDNELIAVQRKDWNDATAKGYAIADNRSAELGEWNHDVLSSTMKKIDDLIDLSGLGFSDAQLDHFRKIDDVLDDVEFPEYNESVEKDVKMIKCPECGHHFAK